MNMGQSIAIKGELSGAEDLTLEGQVEGKINLPGERPHHWHERTYQRRGDRQVDRRAWPARRERTVKEKFELRAGGSMQGNLKAPRIAMADGAIFGGKVEMPGAKAVGRVGQSGRDSRRQKLEPVGV